jgi:DNA polymerase-3 subunit delta
MVAVRTADADRFIASPPEAVRLFLVYGGDAGGITELARRLERHAQSRGSADTVIRFGSDEISSDPGRIADEAYSASLFGGEPVIALRVLDGRHNVLGAVQPILDRPPEAAWLVVEAGELATTSPLRRAFEASPAAAAIPTFPVEGAGLVSFIRASAEAAGMHLEPAAMELLVENLGGDRLSVRSELEKLFLYAGEGGMVSAGDVAAIIGDTTESRIDRIADAALLGEAEVLETELGRLRAEGGSPASVGAQMLRHLLQLAALRAAMDAGLSATAALDRARPPVFSRRRAAVEAQLKRWSAGALAKARRRIAQAVLLTRTQPALDTAAISAALHETARHAQRLARR